MSGMVSHQNGTPAGTYFFWHSYSSRHLYLHGIQLVDRCYWHIMYAIWLPLYRRPIPDCLYPFGELFSGFFMGTVIIGISYYIQTSVLTGSVIWLSIPVAIFIGAIMLSNNIRDLDGDKENGRKTVAILLGRKMPSDFWLLCSSVHTVLPQPM